MFPVLVLYLPAAMSPCRLWMWTYYIWDIARLIGRVVRSQGLNMSTFVYARLGLHVVEDVFWTITAVIEP